MGNCDGNNEVSAPRLSVVRGASEQREVAASRVWAVRDVCEFLGVKKTWVYDRCADNLPGGLPFKRIGACLRFDPDEVRAWWQRQGPEGQAKLSAALRERRASRDERVRARRSSEGDAP